MNCSEFEALLEQRLDERLDPSTVELQAHAQQCETCREHLSRATFLLQAVSTWHQALPIPSAGLTSRILANLPQLHSEPVTARPVEMRPLPPDSRPLNKWQALAMAVASMAALWLVFLGSGFKDNRHPNRDLAAIRPWTPPAAVVAPPVRAPQADFETVLVSAEGAYSQLATETFEVAQDFAMLWPTSRSGSENHPAPAVVPQIPAAGWNPTWPNELAPISNSVGDALDFLWRAAPLVEKTAT